jgi:TPR repeat protein
MTANISFDMELELCSILSELGIPEHLKAYAYLKDLISIAVNDMNALSSDTFYDMVAKKDNVTRAFVSTVIRDAIGTYWNKDSMGILNEHFNGAVQIERARPTNTEFIWLMAEHLRSKYPAELASQYEFRGEYEKAAEYFAKASEQGDLLSTYYLAQYYEQGKGIKQDYAKAAELYVKVSECREPLVFADSDMPLTPQCEAEYAVGCFYEKGFLPNSSMEKAIEWYLCAAEDGSDEACFKMAQLHFDGIDIAQDYEESARYLYNGYYDRRSGNKESLSLALNLIGKTTYETALLEIIGDCYTMGLGVERNDEKAVEYYEKANLLSSEAKINMRKHYASTQEKYDDWPF